MPPGGCSTGLAEPGARSVQEVRDRGRRVTFTWFDPPFRPEPPHSNQAYGICFTAAGMIVLGACDVDGERYWNLLGGGVEPGGTLEDCLVREVMEEGCARVVESRYIGCQRVDDPDRLTGPWRYYQARFWARVELLRWDPQHEVDERRLVRPEDFLRTLSRGSAPRRRHHPGGGAQGRGGTPAALTARRLQRRSPSDPVRAHDVNPAGYCPPAHGRPRAPNTHLGIGETGTELAPDARA
jgi:8-oxo-dGTP pyrophosphatase MutT (NUDIX family)